jgi:hypothetical protein
MNENTGYYSLIQYCPDPSRLEAANVGVVLFCPAKGFLGVRMARRNDRIRRFFGSADRDWDQINAIKLSIKKRLEADRGQFRELSDLERFAATRANAMRLTPPRPVLAEEPEKELQRLFDRLVGGPVQAETAKVRHVLEQAFDSDADLAPLIRKQVTVTLPVFQRPLRVPFGFQNGRFNLIQPTRFQGLPPGSILERAGKYAVEGELLYRHPDEHLGELKLIVVGQFGPGQAQVAQAVGDVFRRNETDLFRLDEVGKLLDLIRTTGQPLRPNDTLA